MQELSLNILDIVQNSIKAGASIIGIEIVSIKNNMKITITDNGCGMNEEQVKSVINPFYTTRTTRKVGLGVPFFKMTAEMTGGNFSITSKVGQGTVVTAEYITDHIDMLPLGDIASTIISLISVNPDIDFVYSYSVDSKSFVMDTRSFKQVLDGAPINAPEVLKFIEDYINENQSEIDANKN